MKKIIISISLLLLSIMFTGCKSRSVGSVSGTGFYFDTVVSFTVYGTDDDTIIKELMSECERYEKIFSPTLEDSELYKLNHSAPAGTAHMAFVSEDLYKCIEKAYSISRIMDGRYDITIRPVSELWDFGSEKHIVPNEKTIEEKLPYVDYHRIVLRGKWENIKGENLDADKNYEGYRIDISPDTMIDLGSVAKGYIGDKLSEYLKEKGYDSAIVSLGGNVQCLGGKLNEAGEYEDFRVAVKSPFPAEDGKENDVKYQEVLSVRDVAVVTSGIYERCFEKDGKLYHHILDAGTGYPVENDLVSVTIVSGSGLEADILSTACFIAGFEETVERLKKEAGITNFQAEFIYKDGSVRKTEGFDEIFLKN